ncbi:histidine kinase [Mucilaginibacter gracilis]|uniref:Histidine kinase n=1 Tax=Mucilaginibacter gracilis TaxID=423350 RepID=A0A495IYZ8_9SPHI|nr:histidine kinase [Mucilaginibacter gracilis]RKR81950.1 histidine kinase [Mucilaginibacter gracilis]
MDKNELRISRYSSLLIALMMNSGKLLALRENGIIARYWHFDAVELAFQMLFNLAFCYLLFYLNLRRNKALSIYHQQKQYGLYYFVNGLIILGAMVTGSLLQRTFFGANRIPGGIAAGYLGRLGLSTVLITIVIKLILLLRDSKSKAIENEQLKNAYMLAELELLKDQINPHFLFNSLSSLSGVIRENPVMAQKYVLELSNVFRYAITKSKVNMVTVNEELTMLRSFAQLIYMRLEGAFRLIIDVPEAFLGYQLPHLTLQPLLENAVKHNAATIAKPLEVKIYIEAGDLVISNNLQEIPVPESSNGVGLGNLNERFKIMMRHELEILKADGQFVVKLPLNA